MSARQPIPICVVAVLLFFSTPRYVNADVDLYGFLSSQVYASKSTTSWVEGGFGRFDSGDNNADSFKPYANFLTQLGLNWKVTSDLELHLHGLARSDQATSTTDDYGLVEAYLAYRLFENSDSDLSVTLGQRFFPSSLEAADELWQTPYTLNFSALNSWIAHEIRPIGLEVDYFRLINESAINVALNIFKGNDAAGAQLGWGGWRFSNRFTVYEEILPLAPLFSLEDTGPFWRQRDTGSQSFSSDLDDKWGGAAMVEIIPSENFRTILSYYDNRGDLWLYRGEYAWETNFYIAGFHWNINEQWELLGEFLAGRTIMGVFSNYVDEDFSAGYLMASWQQNGHRISVRYDDFSQEDRDGTAENNDEDGNGLTLAYLYKYKTWRFGVELAHIDADKAAAVQSGYAGDTGGTQLSLELRYLID